MYFAFDPVIRLTYYIAYKNIFNPKKFILVTHRMVYNELYKKPKDERKSEIVRIWQVMDQITKVTYELKKCKIDVFEPTVSCIFILFYFIKFVMNIIR